MTSDRNVADGIVNTAIAHVQQVLSDYGVPQDTIANDPEIASSTREAIRDAIEAALAKVREEENEACAKVAESHRLGENIIREAADALERLSAPVEGMETTEEERAKVKDAEAVITLRRGDIPGTVLAILRDFDRLQAEVARLKTDLAAATAAREAAEKALGERDDQLVILMLAKDGHLDGCMYKDNPRLSCQCGWHERRQEWMEARRQLTKVAEARALLPKTGDDNV